MSARLMALPFGRILVAPVGAAVIAVGISQIVKGVKQKFVEDLSAGVTQVVRRLGTVGYCAKGVALVIIGGLFGYAALTYDPKKAGGLDAALSTIREQPFGTVLLVIMAVGHRQLRRVLLRLGPQGALLRYVAAGAVSPARSRTRRAPRPPRAGRTGRAPRPAADRGRTPRGKGGSAWGSRGPTR